MPEDQSHDFPALLKPRQLLRGEITYAAAKEQDANILHQLGYKDQRVRFFTHLYRNRRRIKTLIARHLGLASADECRVVDVDDWIHGSFNVCIRVDILDPKGDVRRQIMIRFPLPYRIGENCYRGNADEKVRCECMAQRELSDCYYSASLRVWTIEWQGCMSYTFFLTG